MNDIEYRIGDRAITVRVNTDEVPPLGWMCWDVFEDDRLLTLADAWSTDDGPPSEQQVRAYLHPRRQRLQQLMGDYGIVAGPDYDYDYVYEELFPEREMAEGNEEPPRWLSITRDETYKFFDLSHTFAGATRNLASRVRERVGGVPVGIVDLETGRKVDIATRTLVYERDPGAEGAAEDHTDLAVHRARLVLKAALNELESAVLARVSMLVKREHPTASRLLYDGEENEMGLLHVYVRAIADADGNVLDSTDNSSDGWEELIDEDVEPLLWEISERDESYYGKGKVIELAETP